jgi:hypothetical protein
VAAESLSDADFGVQSVRFERLFLPGAESELARSEDDVASRQD